MSQQTSPLTYEGILELFRQTDLKIQAVAEEIRLTGEQVKATQRTVEATNTKIGALDSRVGEMVEKLVGEGNLVDQFRESARAVEIITQPEGFRAKEW